MQCLQVNRSLLVWLAATESLAPVGLWALGLLGAGALTALALTGWPFGALLLLTASSAMPRVAEVVMGLHLRPEHLSIGVVALVIAGQALKERELPGSICGPSTIFCSPM